MTREEMMGAYMVGDITEKDFKEWVSLNLRLERLEVLRNKILNEEIDLEEPGSLSQQDMADILGVSQQAVSKLQVKGIAALQKRLREELV